MASNRLLCLVLVACFGCMSNAAVNTSGTSGDSDTGGDSSATATDSGGDSGGASTDSGGDPGGSSGGHGASSGSASSGGGTSSSSSSSSGNTGACVPSGAPDAGELRVGEWNMEFFGRADAGPTNDALQTANATTVIGQLAPDLLGLEEVCSEDDFDQVLSGLQSQYGVTYDYVLANDPNIGGAYPGYGGSWGQKTALLYRPEVATLVAAQLVYRSDIDANWGSTFASRDPLEVELRLNATCTPIFVLVIHLKADSDSASYQQRVLASQDLKAYIDRFHANDRVMVIGDWNDDLDGSIRSSQPSPFTNFLDDPAYEFPTKVFADANQSTTDDHSGHPIDHHLIRQALFPALIAGSATIVQPNIANYASTTSDHYPTTVRYHVP